MQEKGSELQPTKREVGPLKLASMDEIVEDMQQAFDSIARRAYEIFESDGRPFGRDLDHWLRAESELLHPLHIEMRESEATLTVKAEVPGFEAKDLEINIEPGRLTIAGNRQWTEEEKQEKVLRSEQGSNQIFRCVGLPVEVDAEKTTATLKDGVLELRMPKTTVSKKIEIQAKAA